MKVFIKLVLLAAITLFALFNYRILNFDKGISKTSMEDKSVTEVLTTVAGITKVEYYKLPFASEDSDSLEDYIYNVYIVTNNDAYLLKATKADITAFNTLSIFSKNLKPNKIKPIPFYVEIILGIIIIFIPFGRRKNKRQGAE